MIEWSYGVTTCDKRLVDPLPRTLKSLAAAGFDRPRLFVDGGKSVPELDLPYTMREKGTGGFYNWILGAWELYVRRPDVDRYAIFEDDIVICRGTREYLEQCDYPDFTAYLNLFTFATNEHRIFGRPQGWVKSDQLGKGALALVFDNSAMATLLKQFFHYRPQVYETKQGTRQFNNTDGAVQHAMVTLAKYREFVHNPSLVQHIGEKSALNNPKHPLAKTFPGEDFDARSLL